MIKVYYRRSCYGNMSYKESKYFSSIEELKMWIKELDSSLGCERFNFSLGKYCYAYINVGRRAIIGDTSRYTIERIDNNEGILFDKSRKHCSRQIKDLFEDLKNTNSEKPLIY